MMKRDEPEFWLKAVGTGDKPLKQRWLEDRPDLLKEVRFPRRRTPSLVEGDRILYYAAGWQRIFAAGELASDPVVDPAPGFEQWPWRADVRLFVLVPDLKRAPDLERVQVWTLSVRSKSHIRLSPRQYREAVAGLAEAAAVNGETYAALL